MSASAYAGSIGDLFGIPIHDWSNPKARGAIHGLAGLAVDFELRYDEMVVTPRALLVGETKHFLWRMRVEAENEAVRQVARAHIVAAYERILGEPYPQQ